jgi:hypothetical protein
MSATGNSAATETLARELPSDMTEGDAADELLKRFMPPEDAKQPSKKAETKTEEEPDPKPDEEEEPSAEEEPEDEAAEKEEGDEDEETESETVVKIKVGDEEHEVPVSKLTRLYGQEAALTKKSMEVAETRKQVESQLATNTAATQALLARAKQRFEPYSKLDFNLLAAQVGRENGLTTEDYQSLRQSAQAAYEDVAFLEKNLDGFMTTIRNQQSADMRTQAVECVKVLSGPADKGGIENWNEKLYDEIRSFAVAQGAPADVINQMVQPWAFRLLHNAMLYARGKDKTKVVTTKVNKTPKKIVKTTESPAASRRTTGTTGKVDKAMERLRTSGDPDDAVDVIMARWQKSNASSDD